MIIGTTVDDKDDSDELVLVGGKYYWIEMIQSSGKYNTKKTFLGS